jgi:hypothetical protein
MNRFISEIERLDTPDQYTLSLEDILQDVNGGVYTCENWDECDAYIVVFPGEEQVNALYVSDEGIEELDYDIHKNAHFRRANMNVVLKLVTHNK